MRKALLLFGLGLGVTCCDACAKRSPAALDARSAPASASSAEADDTLPPENKRPQVPGFDGATAWLNVDRPLSLEDLRGRVVIVDFWTSCCINCIQTLPTLAAIEKRFAGQPVVVVGVHSPKFDAETERERLRAAIAEYSIAHPVAVDGSMKVWNAWGVSGWPTLFVLDAKGRAVWTDSGEPDAEELTAVVTSALAEGARESILATAPIAGLHAERADSGPLAFPGKAIPLADGGVAISDTSHHRVVFVAADGKASDVVGTGLAGALDGSYGEASFKKPQGLAEAGDIVYVADTENHLVRAIDRKQKRVTTVAGTGALGRGPVRDATPAREVALRSPWDLSYVNGALYVALAGSHQIAAFDPKAGTIRGFAGDGRERRRDGKGMEASFAQPSGLATDGKSTLFVADSETSSVRAIDLGTTGVRTIVGEDLFVFGDIDGAAKDVRLQHPIGIAYGQGALFVADTYNSKIKRIDPQSGRTQTIAGQGHLFLEPAGLFVRGGDVTVVDTHHHRLASFPIARPGELHALAIDGLTAPAQGVAVANATEQAPHDRVTLPSVAIATRGATTVHVKWQIPSGTGVNEEAPFKTKWRVSEGLAKVPEPVTLHGKDVMQGFDVSLAASPGATRARLVGEVDVVVCDIATHRVCRPLKREVELLLDVKDGAPTDATVTLPMPPALP